MTKWQDYFDVVPVTPKDQDASDWMLGYNQEYAIVDKNDVVIGTYKDYKYAIKQAKYKFKKIMSGVERILLG